MTAVPRWIYDQLVTRPLRVLYYSGPVWQNRPLEEICYEMTKVEAKHWVSSPENLERCHLEIERHFQSLNSTVMAVLYFAVLLYIIVRIIRGCANLLPWNSRHKCMCGCQHLQLQHHPESVRPVTMSELKEILRLTLTEQQQHGSSDVT